MRQIICVRSQFRFDGGSQLLIFHSNEVVAGIVLGNGQIGAEI